MSTPYESRGRVTVNAKGARQLKAGHPWVYKSDVTRAEASDAGVVEVVGPDGRTFGFGLFSPRSVIQVRLLFPGALSPGAKALDRAWLTERLVAARTRRARTMVGADAFRWVHGEADFLPGVFIDVYGDAIAMQTMCAGAEALEPELVSLILELAKPRALVLKNDAASRAREGLRQHVTLAHGEAPVVARYHEGALELEVELLADQKTGSFLDQAVNHVIAGRYARGVGLDCFTYHGGFALQLAHGGCTSVLAVDQSELAVERARANATRLGLGQVECQQADVFELLPKLASQGRRFDTIVVDPPAFASGRDTIPAARRAYHEVNQRALKLLNPGGILVTCSCSGRFTAEDFDTMLLAAAYDANRPIHILERRQAAPDHPVLGRVPETDYLKCRVVMAL